MLDSRSSDSKSTLNPYIAALITMIMIVLAISLIMDTRTQRHIRVVEKRIAALEDKVSVSKIQLTPVPGGVTAAQVIRASRCPPGVWVRSLPDGGMVGADGGSINCDEPVQRDGGS